MDPQSKKLSQFLFGHQRCLKFGDVIMEYKIFYRDKLQSLTSISFKQQQTISESIIWIWFPMDLQGKKLYQFMFGLLGLLIWISFKQKQTRSESIFWTWIPMGSQHKFEWIPTDFQHKKLSQFLFGLLVTRISFK